MRTRKLWKMKTTLKVINRCILCCYIRLVLLYRELGSVLNNQCSFENFKSYYESSYFRVSWFSLYSLFGLPSKMNNQKLFKNSFLKLSFFLNLFQSRLLRRLVIVILCELSSHLCPFSKSKFTPI